MSNIEIYNLKSELKSWQTLAKNSQNYIKEREKEISFFLDRIENHYITLLKEDMLTVEDMQEDIQPFLDKIAEEKRIDDIIDQSPNKIHLVIDGKIFSSEE